MSEIVNTLETILKINSPSGYTKEIINYLITEFRHLPLNLSITNKGSLLVSFSDNPELVIASHVDTLGGMVKQINGDGTLEITKIGGLQLNSFEGEYVTVRNYSGELFRGTFLMNNPAAHVNDKLSETKRETSVMSIRLDELVDSPEKVKKLNIGTGNFVFFDTRFEHTKSGFIKSRFLDNKACVAVMVELIKHFAQEGYKGDTAFYFSNYEEVGHGACVGIPESAKELLVLDMAVVGEGCNGKEDLVSICPKDSSGPYDFDVTNKLMKLAKDFKINHVIDIYPYYGSDGSAALASGTDVRVGLIGPGVSASHGVERTHINGLLNTYNLTYYYIINFNY
ncbi:MAG TPA: glucanase [Bacteroidetes bacterium]|nr:glucanase [Bacteroidota bacterium]HCN37121.1 glucanase [Bacteroidota bacterium]